MIGEWDNHWWLWLSETNSALDFNLTDPVTGWRYQLVPGSCSAVLPVRTTEDDKPQGDGKIPHRRWRSGYQVHLAIEPLIEVGGEFECPSGGELVQMLDELGLFLNAMIRTGLIAGLPNARLIWTPSGGTSTADDRMFDRLQLVGAPQVTLGGTLGGVLVEVDFDTPYPYYISSEETQTALSGTGVQTIYNAGNTDSFPVIEVYGPSSSFVVLNDSVLDFDGNPLNVTYNDALPGAVAVGGGDYIEFVHFVGTAYLNGSGARRLSGVDFRATTFFPLVPGDNFVAVVGATALVKSNDAWA